MNLPLNIDIRQILLHMLNFVLLFGGLYFILYSPVKNFIEKRAKMYSDMDEKAQEALKSAEDCKKNYEEKLASAEKEIAEMKVKAQAAAEQNAKNISEKAKNEANEILNKARALAEYESQESLRNANAEISKIAVSATKKMVFNSTEEAFDAFLKAKGDAEGEK